MTVEHVDDRTLPCGEGVPQPTAGNASLTDTGRSMWGGTRGPHPCSTGGVFMAVPRLGGPGVNQVSGPEAQGQKSRHLCPQACGSTGPGPTSNQDTRMRGRYLISVNDSKMLRS